MIRKTIVALALAGAFAARLRRPRGARPGQEGGDRHAGHSADLHHRAAAHRREGRAVQEVRRQRRAASVRQRHRGGARRDLRRRRHVDVALAAGDHPDLQLGRQPGGDLRLAQCRLGARLDRSGESQVLGHGRPGRRRRFGRRGALGRAALAARRRLPGREDRPGPAGRARLERVGRHAGRPPHLRRAPPRRPRADRVAGQEAARHAGDEEDQPGQPLPGADGARRQAQGEPRRLCAHGRRLRGCGALHEGPEERRYGRRGRHTDRPSQGRLEGGAQGVPGDRLLAVRQ